VETRQRVQARDTSDWAEKAAAIMAGCHPRQRGFVEDEGRRVCALVPRGGGKTTAASARLIRRMLRTHRARCVYIATTRAQAEELLWLRLKDLVEKLSIEAVFNETKLRCTFKRNQATVRLVGADDKREIEKLRGQAFHEVMIDEAASYPASLLDNLTLRIIGPRLGDYDGVLSMIGTPGHTLSGPFYDATRPGSDIARAWSERDREDFAGWVKWSIHSWTLEDGAKYVPAIARVWAEAKVEKLRQGWSDEHPIWRREYLGQWAADDTERVYKYRPHTEDGAPLNQWNPERNVRGFAKLPEGISNWQFVYGMDMGHSDPFALEIFAWSPTDPAKMLYHVYEFERRGMYARTIAELLLGEGLDHEHPTGVMAETGWPDGIDADLAGLGDALIDELGNVYGIAIKAAEKKSKFDNIELFNGDLIDGRICILKGSALEAQLMDLQWQVDDFGRLKEDKGQRNDCCDAAIYARRRAQHLYAQEAPAPRPVFGPRVAAEEPPDLAPGEYDGLLSDGPYPEDALWGNG
jgi:hypothetical protein